MQAGAVAELESGEQLRARAVVGADGVHSSIGAALGIPTANYTGYAAFRCAQLWSLLPCLCIQS